MKRNTARVIAGSAGFSALSLGFVASASADSTSQIVNGLKSSNIYTSPGVSFSSDVKSSYSGSNIAIVYNQAEGTNATQTANEIAAGLKSDGNTNFDTVIVYSGSSFGAASTTGNASKISETLNGKGTGVEALITESSTVKNYSNVLTSSTETNTSSAGLGAGQVLLGGAGILLGVAILLSAGFAVFRSISKKNNKNVHSIDSLSSDVDDIVAEDYFNNISQELGAEVHELRELIKKHRKNGLDDGVKALMKVDDRLGDLFTRLSRKGTNEQMSIAAVKYHDLLKKIIFIMNEDHYMDVVLNPELWNRAEMRKQSSLEAVEAVDKQILNNIKQLNDSQDLDFNITLRALMTDSDNMSEIEEMLFKNDVDDHKSFGK